MFSQFGLLIGLLIGAALSSQGAVNGRLAGHVGGALQAASISFTVGLATLLVVALVIRQPLPSVSGIAAAPWWALIGGCLGAAAVSGAAYFVPQIGVGTWVAAIIAGQLLGALIIDHFGWLSITPRPLSTLRSLGVVFLVAGVLLIERGGR